MFSLVGRRARIWPRLFETRAPVLKNYTSSPSCLVTEMMMTHKHRSIYKNLDIPKIDFQSILCRVGEERKEGRSRKSPMLRSVKRVIRDCRGRAGEAPQVLSEPTSLRTKCSSYDASGCTFGTLILVCFCLFVLWWVCFVLFLRCLSQLNIISLVGKWRYMRFRLFLNLPVSSLLKLTFFALFHPLPPISRFHQAVYPVLPKQQA